MVMQNVTVLSKFSFSRGAKYGAETPSFCSIPVFGAKRLRNTVPLYRPSMYRPTANRLRQTQ